MSEAPLIGEDGEVRELTSVDMARAIPFDKLPADVQATLRQARPVDRFMNQCLVQEALTSIAAAVPDHERCAVAMLVVRQVVELAYAAGARDGAVDMGNQVLGALKTTTTEKS